MCLFTETSETHWASVLTQMPMRQKNENIERQERQYLAFSLVLSRVQVEIAELLKTSISLLSIK